MPKSSHPMLSRADGLATAGADILLLVGRILIAAVFLMTVWGGNPTANYLTSINFVAPEFMSILARVVEWIVVVSLIGGIATRYGALLALLFVIIAVIASHLWWTYPAAAQGLQYVFFTKDVAIAGGLVVLFVSGGGRISVDEMLKS